MLSEQAYAIFIQLEAAVSGVYFERVPLSGIFLVAVDWCGFQRALSKNIPTSIATRYF